MALTFLDQEGLTTLWSRIKTHVQNVVSQLITVNGVNAMSGSNVAAGGIMDADIEFSGSILAVKSNSAASFDKIVFYNGHLLAKKGTEYYSNWGSSGNYGSVDADNPNLGRIPSNAVIYRNINDNRLYRWDGTNMTLVDLGYSSSGSSVEVGSIPTATVESICSLS